MATRRAPHRTASILAAGAVVLVSGLLLALGSSGAPRAWFLVALVMIVAGAAAVLLSIRLKRDGAPGD